MTVAELIDELKELPQDFLVYYEGNDYKSNWVEVSKIEIARRSTEVSWGHTGVFIL